ncbi:facilitated trehalose transporter Tret1-like [Photinus pyralis]|uniref:facilitated trehalose transporter Tret1-like n=1 Tax=Photinus pyralis TaxID=7054 RepID=UPI0012671EAD|nr:facilitated trehalose transporter Tret1-like [Photinus pyralis]
MFSIHPLKEKSLQYTAALTSLLATISSGLHLGWTSPYLQFLLSKDSPIPMTNDQSAWVATVYMVGGPFGALFTGAVLDLIGRKTVLLASSLAFFVSWMLIAFATTLHELLIGRFFAGFCDGLIFGAIPIYFGEILYPEIRGLLGCSITIAFQIGTVLMNVIGSYLTIRDSALVFSVIPVLFLVTFIWMPESPNYFLIKGKTAKAKRCLVALKGERADETMSSISMAIEKENLKRTRFADLFKKVNRRSLLIVIALRMTQEFSGVVAFTFYAQTIFEEAGDAISPLLSTVIFYVVQIVFSFISSLFVDKIGRRPLLITSTVGSGVTLLGGGIFFLMRDVVVLDTASITWLPTVILIIFIISFSLGLQTMPLFIGSEIFPTNVKAYAGAISDVFYYAFAGISSKYFQFTKDEYGMYVPFFSFAICCGVGLILIIYFVPESKNKTLEQIQTELNTIQQTAK